MADRWNCPLNGDVGGAKNAPANALHNGASERHEVVGKNSVNAALRHVPARRGAQDAIRALEHARCSGFALELPVEPRDRDLAEKTAILLAVRAQVSHAVLPP